MAVKKTAAEAVEKKAAAKTSTAADKKTAAKAAAAKTAEAKKAEAVKEEKAPAKKAPARKALQSTLYVQFAGKEFTEKELVDAAKKAYVALGHKVSDIKTLEVYVKPEESVAYYAVNGAGSADYKIEL